MQVKKFEAPTLQEALDTIKRELGPEAIILQTKQNKRGFGLMSKNSVEVTAAVSERAIAKKSNVDKRIPEEGRQSIQKLPAKKQADIYDKQMERHLASAMKGASDRVEVNSRAASAAANAARQSGRAPASQSRGMGQGLGMSAGMAAQSPQAPEKKITTRRYIDIEDDAPAPTGGRKLPIAPEPASMRGGAASANGSMRIPVPTAYVSGGVDGTMPLEEEVRHLKRMIEELKNAQDDGQTGSGAQALIKNASLESPALQDVYEQLVIGGVDKRYALTLVKKVSFELGLQNAGNPEDVLDQVAAEIMSTTEVLSPLNGLEKGAQGPIVLALVGPTGVGKTTTVAKIASEALLKRSLRVGLINFDSYKVAAFDQLATYAKILNVPFRSAASLEDLQAAIADFQNLDLVLVDTTGRSQRDPNSLKEMDAMLRSVAGLQTQLVLSATTRDTELYDMASRFSMFKPQGIIISKLDEATIYGSVYNVVQRTKLPLLYFTTGQRVPEDIEEASRERVAALLMDL